MDKQMNKWTNEQTIEQPKERTDFVLLVLYFFPDIDWFWLIFVVFKFFFLNHFQIWPLQSQVFNRFSISKVLTNQNFMWNRTMTVID